MDKATAFSIIFEKKYYGKAVDCWFDSSREYGGKIMSEKKSNKFKCSHCGWVGGSDSVSTKGPLKNKKDYPYIVSLCPKCKKEVGRKLADG